MYRNAFNLARRTCPVCGCAVEAAGGGVGGLPLNLVVSESEREDVRYSTFSTF
jgi:hypothetical protein